MSDLVNVVKALSGSKFDVRSFEAKNRVFEFNHQQMNTFEFVRCSSQFGECFCKSSKSLLGSMFVRSKPKIGCSSSIPNK